MSYDDGIVIRILHRRWVKKDTAILVIGYNREDKLERCLRLVKSIAGDRNVYVAIDGPKCSDEDVAKVERCRAIAAEAERDMKRCSVYFEKSNKGCRAFVISSISWVSRHENYFIVVEDDVMISQGFVRMTDEVKRSWPGSEYPILCGCSYEDKLDSNRADGDWFYTGLVNVWGWAVSSKVWIEFLDWSARKKRLTAIAVRLWKKIGITKALHVLTCYIYSEEGRIDTWDYDFATFLILRSVRCYSPVKALTTNLGFGMQATHTRDEEPEGLAKATQVLENSERLVVDLDSLRNAYFAKDYQKEMTVNIPFRREYFTQALKGMARLALGWIQKGIWRN